MTGWVIPTPKSSLQVQGYTDPKTNGGSSTGEFPVGTGIYRTASANDRDGFRVPCRYRDIPYDEESAQAKIESSLQVQGYNCTS